MSFGKMNTIIELVSPCTTKDTEGFVSHGFQTQARIRAYREGRHGSEMWANRAAFSAATDLFRFRVIPNVEVTESMIIVCDGEKFEITSVEDVKGRKMYIEVLAKRIIPTGG